ncbi:hypothetical protein WMY93_005905 [Mugilogobius chulae]|uniref:Uncharacterized protein n=1 Tax=Mugilogobius chulae TaxID=88201 RepID=A0AAW0PIK6_9GOBI
MDCCYLPKIKRHIRTEENGSGVDLTGDTEKCDPSVTGHILKQRHQGPVYSPEVLSQFRREILRTDPPGASTTSESSGPQSLLRPEDLTLGLSRSSEVL